MRSLIIVRSFLYENKAIQVDKNIISNYNYLKEGVFERKNYDLLLPFIHASDSFKIDFNNEELT